MNLRQQIRKERKAYFASATPKEKLAYIWEYYGLYISIGLILAGIITYIIVQAVTAPETILNGTFTNSYNHENYLAISDFEESYMKDRKIDTSEYTVSFSGNLTLNNSNMSTAYQSRDVIITQIAGESLDFIVGPATGLINFAYDDLFVDLSKVLTPEQYEYYKPYFLYVDKAVIAKLQDLDSTTDTSAIDIPALAKPDQMKEPVTVLIDLSSTNKLDYVYGKSIDGVAYAIVFNATNMEQTIDLLEYLMR